MKTGVDGCDKEGLRVLASRLLGFSKFAGECVREVGAETGGGESEDTGLPANGSTSMCTPLECTAAFGTKLPDSAEPKAVCEEGMKLFEPTFEVESAALDERVDFSCATD